jgi:hypothetical protein
MYASPRSCNRDLHAGMTDGTYKKAAPNRGGEVEPTFANARRQMSGAWHGFNEVPMKVLGDGRPDHPPYFMDIAPVDKENI